MKKTLILALALALVGGVAYANFCARDYVPAATLLVPYAVVDLDSTGVPNPSGYTTLLAVTNVSSAKQLIHVVVWDAQSDHVVDFDEVLSGYDVWTINFRDLLTGAFNSFDTSSTAGFFTGTISTKPVVPYGPTTNDSYVTPLPEPFDTDAATPSSSGCNFPYGPLTSFGPAIVTALQAAIITLPQYTTCQVASVANPPWLANLTDNPVFFYVTVDVVTACNQNFPDEDGYWTGGFPSTQNTLIGDIIYLNQTANFSESVPAVAIEADTTWEGNIGFYSRYSDAALVDDFHEPLGTAFAFRYFDSGGITSNLMLWKTSLDITLNADDDPVFDACRPYIYFAWDENENTKARGAGGPSGFLTAEPNVIPFETQKVPLDVLNWNGLLANNGWMLLVFDPSIPFHGPFTSANALQAWAGVQYYFGTYSTALEAATLGNVWCFAQDVLPPAGTLNYYDGALEHRFAPTP